MDITNVESREESTILKALEGKVKETHFWENGQRNNNYLKHTHTHTHEWPDLKKWVPKCESSKLKSVLNLITMSL